LEAQDARYVYGLEALPLQSQDHKVWPFTCQQTPRFPRGPL